MPRNMPSPPPWRPPTELSAFASAVPLQPMSRRLFISMLLAVVITMSCSNCLPSSAISGAIAWLGMATSASVITAVVSAARTIGVFMQRSVVAVRLCVKPLPVRTSGCNELSETGNKQSQACGLYLL